ncbi:hypothetical protein D3875_21870 [Deinococcus cavernae]|uniref:Uncharacterized protein n=1 Tax=Deinococcus cavernae TaxID=2320857 RepID=A0A418UZV0_9DEIO|nr:hypothetical protein [Deinococcus cavernae]RJF68980.1 hypothetical protein D3875_21870 [Deinococcus cavernae]
MNPTTLRNEILATARLRGVAFHRRAYGVSGIQFLALTEPQLGQIVDQLLPSILAAVQETKTAFGDRRLSWAEAVNLGTIVSGIVSRAVRDSGAVQGTEGGVLAELMFGVLFDRLIVPFLPMWLKPFSGIMKAGIVKGLRTLYDRLLKGQVAAPAAP